MKLFFSIATLSLIGVMGFFQSSLAEQIDNRTPGSYEFKMMLKKNTFTSVEKGIKAFQKKIVQEAEVSFSGKVEEEERIVTYLDTKKYHLYRNGFMLRKRFSINDGIPTDMKVTLKFRNKDLNAVSNRAFSPELSTIPVKPKFEADVIKNTTTSTGAQYIYSHSASVKFGKFKKISQLMELYPVLKELETVGTPKIQGTMKLKRVNKFVAHETVIEVGTLKINQQECDASFTFWYEAKKKQEPIVVEFSYVCKNATDEALKLYQTILSLDDWVSEDSMTKTDLVYGD